MQTTATPPTYKELLQRYEAAKKELAKVIEEQDAKQNLLAKVFAAGQLEYLEKGQVKKWSKATIVKALKVRLAMGVRGMKSMREVIQYPLPAYSTLSGKLVNYKLQFRVFETLAAPIKEKVNLMLPIEKYCFLLIDEMAIARKFDYDKNRKLFYGNISVNESTKKSVKSSNLTEPANLSEELMMPSNMTEPANFSAESMMIKIEDVAEETIQVSVPIVNSEKQKQLGNHALIALVQGITQKWKQVVRCHITSDSIDGKDLKTFVFDCISFLENCGLNVVALGSDMGRNNMNLWRELRVNVSWKKRVFSFIHNNHDLFVIPDACHLLKNLKLCTQKQVVYLSSDYVAKNNLPSRKVDGTYVNQLWQKEIDTGVKLRLLHHCEQISIHLVLRKWT